MPTYLEELITAAKRADFSPAEREAQRRSFAYGNTHIENKQITRQMIDEQADAIEIEANLQ
jgi:hypothetical protein